MQIIQTSAIVKDGQLILDQREPNLPNNTKLKVVIIVPENEHKEEFEEARLDLQQAFKKAGIETREQVLDLIREVKLELLKERDL